MERSAQLRQAAVQHHPELEQRPVEAALPALSAPFGGEFDGVLCSAVLMHLAEADLFDAAFALRRILRRGGRLLISLPSARTDVGSGERGSLHDIPADPDRRDFMLASDIIRRRACQD